MVDFDHPAIRDGRQVRASFVIFVTLVSLEQRTAGYVWRFGGRLRPPCAPGAFAFSVSFSLPQSGVPLAKYPPPCDRDVRSSFVLLV